MKLIVEIINEKDRRELEKLLKSVNSTIRVVGKTKRPIESLLSFAERNAYHVKKVIIPGRDERNER